MATFAATVQQDDTGAFVPCGNGGGRASGARAGDEN
jgi:hypothetical protein